MSLGSLNPSNADAPQGKTKRVLARLIQLSKNRLPVWQESNSGFGDSTIIEKDVKAEKRSLRGISTF